MECSSQGYCPPSPAPPPNRETNIFEDCWIIHTLILILIALKTLFQSRTRGSQFFFNPNTQKLLLRTSKKHPVRDLLQLFRPVASLLILGLQESTRWLPSWVLAIRRELSWARSQSRCTPDCSVELFSIDLYHLSENRNQVSLTEDQRLVDHQLVLDQITPCSEGPRW